MPFFSLNSGVFTAAPVLSDSYYLIFLLPFFFFSLLSPFNLPLILYPSSQLAFYACSLPSHPLLLIFYPCPLIFLSHVHIYHFFPLFQFLPTHSHFLDFIHFLTHNITRSSHFFTFIQLFSFSPGLMTRVWSLIRRPSQSDPWCWVTSRGRVQRLPIRSDHFGAMETVSHTSFIYVFSQTVFTSLLCILIVYTPTLGEWDISICNLAKETNNYNKK